ncbi:DUF4905 domain-containing protein [Pontibacter cellulosilyticus]|uniref:DUF4905 domain-containing protein n=1 Tax=Pontibacter cellulosilyticus TaxID=1720253 RepID=A0A923N546_9BACT|nr:DUF4905 domain-containing protein [Pontibacter cellulosilyticus]MBC5992388.1 DUF4905 domain-containing protein [Pontibacter cellulosilyticus]
MWRIRIDTSTPKLALEVRDSDLLLAHFCTLDLAEFRLNKLAVNPSKAWWQGLEDAQHNLVFLHGYGDRKTGQHKGVTALAAEGGEVQWQLDEMAFYGLASDGMLVYRADAPDQPLTLVNPKTGNTLRDGISQQTAASLVADFSQTRYTNWEYPVMYKDGEPYFEEVCNFIADQSGEKPVVALEYAELSNNIVISYYEEGAVGNLDNFVVVYDLQGNLHLKVKLGSGLSGIGSDTFFIFNLQLYLLRDKHILQVYRLLA